MDSLSLMRVKDDNSIWNKIPQVIFLISYTFFGWRSNSTSDFKQFRMAFQANVPP